MLILIIITTTGCGIMAGVFFAFSTFVMKGLGRLQTSNGITAMQAINKTAINSGYSEGAYVMVQHKCVTYLFRVLVANF